MKLTAFFLGCLLTGCGFKASGQSDFVVSGDAVVTHRFEVDYSICNELPETDRIECIKALIDVIKSQEDDADGEDIPSNPEVI